MADTIRTQTDLTTNLFQDGQAANSITAQDMRDLIVSVPALVGNGWINTKDSTYTSGSPLAVAASTRTAITIDGLGSGTDTTNLDETIWNTTSNKVTPTVANSCYDLRLSFKGEFTSGSSAYVNLDLDIGGGLGIILEETRPFLKGSGTTQNFVFSWPIFTGSTFVSNGGTLYVTNDQPCNYWDFHLFVTRTIRPAQ